LVGACFAALIAPFRRKPETQSIMMGYFFMNFGLFSREALLAAAG